MQLTAPLPDDPALIVDELRELESLKCAAEARQARLALKLDAAQRRRAQAAGVEREDRSRGVASQVALARRASPHRGRQMLSLARHLEAELPHTLAAFDAGRISEWRATIIARESACLDREQRAIVDQTIAGDLDALEAMGDRELASACRTLAAERDPGAVAARRRRAETERRVSLRPAPDSMVYLTTLLPVAEGVSTYAALKAAGQQMVSDGESSSLGQAMADTLVRRVTGSPNGVVPLSLRITISDRALFAGAHDTAILGEFGPIAAGHARSLISDAFDAEQRVWFKSLYTDVDGNLTAMDSTARRFPAGIAEILDLRDQTCRTPWCDAPIKHHDHIRPARAGGPTSVTNGQGLCEACNQAKEATGWTAHVIDDDRHTVRTTTPTGHTYSSTAPPLPAPMDLMVIRQLARAG